MEWRQSTEHFIVIRGIMLCNFTGVKGSPDINFFFFHTKLFTFNRFDLERQT